MLRSKGKALRHKESEVSIAEPYRATPPDSNKLPTRAGNRRNETLPSVPRPGAVKNGPSLKTLLDENGGPGWPCAEAGASDSERVAPNTAGEAPQ